MKDSQYLLKLCEEGKYETAYSALQEDPMLVQDLGSEYLSVIQASFLNNYPEGVDLLENLVSSSNRPDKDRVISIFETAKELKRVLNVRDESN